MREGDDCSVKNGDGDRVQASVIAEFKVLQLLLLLLFFFFKQKTAYEI